MNAKVENGMTIQQVAEETGLSVHTLRYYERIGLISRVGRAPNGHRRYTERDVGWARRSARPSSHTGIPTAQRWKHAAS